MKNKQLGFTAFELIVAALVLAGIGGWVANIVKLIGMIDGVVTAMFVIRIVGLFVPPLGAILGFM